MNNCLVVSLSEEDMEPINKNSSFFDANGYCLDFFLNKDNPDFEVSFSKMFRKEIANNVKILFINSDASRLYGWYKKATVYMQKQFHMPTQREYRAICETKDAFLLTKENRLAIPMPIPRFRDAMILDEYTSKKLIAFIDTIQETSKFVNLDLSISTNRDYNVEDKRDVENVFREYQETTDVFLLPSLYWKALNWSTSEPNNVEALDYIGVSLLELARPQEALLYFENALHLDPMKKGASHDKGECLIRLNRTEEAINWLNTAFEKFPEDNIRIILSDAYLLAGFPGISYRLLKEIQSKDLHELVSSIIREREKAMPYLLNENPDSSILNAYPSFFDFKAEPLPEVYEDINGVRRYIDPIRQKGIPITPEETVRQKVISYLQSQLSIPKEAIQVEESLAHIDRELRDRVDILISFTQSGQKKHLLLIECKAPGIELDGEPTKQILRYNTILQAPFVLLTNGEISHLYHFDVKTGTFEAMRSLPSYKEMCESLNIKYARLKPSQWVRPEYAVLSQPEVIQSYVLDGLIGEDSPQELKPFLMNLAFCLFDDKHRIECPLTAPGCTIINDYGVIPMTLGNAGGGKFYGHYRWFGVHDRYGKRQNVYVSVFGSLKTKNDSHWGTRSGITMLYFAIEERGKAVPRLQLRLDSCLIPDGNGYRLTHTGVRSRGKILPLLNFIDENVPELLGDGGRILCGKLDKTKNLYLSDFEVAQTFGRAISYLLLRSEYHLIEKEDKIE